MLPWISRSVGFGRDNEGRFDVFVIDGLVIPEDNTGVFEVTTVKEKWWRDKARRDEKKIYIDSGEDEER